MTAVAANVQAPIALGEPPGIDTLIEVELSTGTHAATVRTRRALAPGLWQLVATVDGGETLVLTVRRADDGGWYAYDSNAIGRALSIAQAVADGKTLHTPINTIIGSLAEAVLALAAVSHSSTAGN